MKKFIVATLATIGIAVVLPVSAFAATGNSDIAGTVTTSKGAPVSGASVSVTCNGNTLTSGTTVAGAYIVQFAASDCPAGSTANVTASKGGGSGSKSGAVNALGANINLAIVNVSIVPEFGLVAGAGAALMGGAAFMVVRRKQLSQS